MASAEPAPTDYERLRQESRSTSGSSLPEAIVVLSIFLAIVGVASGSVQLTGVSVLVIMVVLASRAWARLALAQVRLVRSLGQQRVFVGDELTVAVSLENRKVLPLPWVRLEFTVPDGLRIGMTVDLGTGVSGVDYGQGLYETFSLARFERIRAVRPLFARRRGCYRLGAASLESGDLFGFFITSARTLTHGEELVVFPTPRPMPAFHIPARAPDGESRGPAQLHEDFSRLRGAREYQPGDAINRIDWKASARHRQPMVRTYDPSNGHQVVVLLECETGEAPWRERPDHLEAAVSAAASVMVLGIEAGHQVGLVTNGLSLASGRPVLHPATGRGQLDLMMHTLARVQYRPSEPLVERYARHAAPHLQRGQSTSLVLVAAFAHPQIFEWLAAQSDAGMSAQCVFVGPELPDSLPPQIEFHHYPDEFLQPDRLEPGGQIIHA